MLSFAMHPAAPIHPSIHPSTLPFFPNVLQGHLCDRLLAANVSALAAPDGGGPTLHLCVLLANSFATYQQRWDLWGGGGARRAGAGHAIGTRHASGSEQDNQDGCESNDKEEEDVGKPRRPDTMLHLLSQGKWSLTDGWIN